MRIKEGVPGVVDNIELARLKPPQQFTMGGFFAPQNGHSDAWHALEQSLNALAFLLRALQIAGRIDDQQNVESRRLGTFLAPLGD